MTDKEGNLIKLTLEEFNRLIDEYASMGMIVTKLNMSASKFKTLVYHLTGLKFSEYKKIYYEDKGLTQPMVYKKRNVDWDEVRDYLRSGTSISQIGRIVGIQSCHLYNRCRRELGCTIMELREEQKALGDACLRKAMYDKGMSGDTKMLIFLSKNRLGYSENPDNKTNDDQTINVNFNLKKSIYDEDSDNIEE